MLNTLLLLLLLVGAAALYARQEAIRDELRRDPSGAVSLRAATVAFREMERGAVVMVEFDELPVTMGGADEDRYLAQARRAIQAELRDTDVIGRRGCGFVVLLPGTDAPNASRKLMHIRAQLERLRPAAARARFGLSHTDSPDAWGSALEQLRGTNFPDHFPPPGAPVGLPIPVHIAAEVAGARRIVASVTAP